MRNRSRLRLGLRDLAMAAAFASMAVSGQLPMWVMGAVLFALVLALLNLRPLTRAPRLTSLLLLPVAGVLFLAVRTGQMDLVVAACSFASFVSVQRLLSAPEPGTDGHVLLVGLLMIAGGAALSGDLLFAVSLIAFAVLASLSMGLSVVESAVPAGEPIPVRQVLRPLSSGLLFAVLGALTFFFLFPRFNWNMGARRTAPGLGGAATSGFADTVRLGGSGTLKTNPRVVLRARLEPDPKRDQLDAYWVGRTYDTFDGQEWSTIGSPGRRRKRVTLRPGAEGLIYQRVELLPSYGSRSLIALETPSRLGNALALTPAGTRPTSLQEFGGDELRFVEPALGYTYEVYSVPPGTNTVPGKLEQLELDQLLALPENLDPRVEQLARQVVAGEKDPLAAATRLVNYLQREYSYTLELSGDMADPLADFLFVRKAGHCEHFATALTLMLRTQGFQARLATGFFGGERVSEGYILRAGDAHAWTHVLVPGRGFVTLDATPPAHRASQSVAVLQWLITLYETVEERWRSSVVDYSFRDQLDFLRSLTRPPLQPVQEEEQPATGRRLPPARAWGTALLAGAAVYLVWTRLSRVRAAPRALEATRLVDKVERLLAPVGLAPQEGETLEDVAARLTRESHPVAPALGTLTRRYLEARFGQRPLQAGEASRLLQGLEGALANWRQPSQGRRAS
jgi:transglutaminase-like putative cysteine protease